MGAFRTEAGDIVQAFRWTGDGGQVEEPLWAIEAMRDGRLALDAGGTEVVGLLVSTPSGIVRAARGTWIVMAEAGSLSAWSDDLFAHHFQPVRDGSAHFPGPGA